MAKKPSRNLPDNPDAPSSVTETGSAPNERISTASQAFQIYEKLKRESEAQAFARAKIQGQLDGNSPIPPSEMKRVGLGGEPNINFRETESIIERKAGTLWRMQMEVPVFIQLEPNFEDPTGDGFDWGEIIAEEFTFILRNRWTDFPWHTMLTNMEMLKFGVGPKFWPDQYDYRSESMETASVLIPASAPSTPSGSDLVMIRRELPLTQAFNLVEHAKEAEKQGWNIKALKQFIVDSFTNAYAGEKRYAKLSSFESIQREIRNGSSNTTIEFDKPRVVDILVTEFKGINRGKVSHYMIQEYEEPEEFLLKKQAQYESMSSAMCVFFYGVATGHYKSVRGLGHKLYPFGELSNRMMNKAISAADLAAGLICQPRSEGAMKRLQFWQHGPLRMLDPQVDAIQATFQPPLEKLLSVRASIQQIENSNFGVYRIGQDAFTQRERTAKEAMIQNQNESAFDTNDAAWYYYQWELFMRETFRRLLNPKYPAIAEGYADHAEFVKRCLARKVPSVLLRPESWTASAVRAIGLGSMSLQLEYTSQMLGQIGLFTDELARQKIMHDFVTPRLGLQRASRYAPKALRQKSMTSEKSRAVMEGKFFRMGEYIPAGSDDLHTYHTEQHLGDAEALVAAYGKGQLDPEQGALVLGFFIKHLAEHVAYMSVDPTRRAIVREIVDLLRKFQQVMKQMESAAAKIQEERQSQQQALQAAAENQQSPMSEEMRLKLRKLNDDLQVRMMRETKMDELRKMSQYNKNKIRELMAIAKIQRDNNDAED